MKNAKIEKFKCFNVCNGGVPTISRLRCLLVVDDCENKLPFYMQKRGVKIRHHHDIMFNIIVFSTLVVNPLLSLYMFIVFNMAKKHKNFLCVSGGDENLAYDTTTCSSSCEMPTKGSINKH